MMNSSIIEKLRKAGVIDATGVVDKTVLASYTQTHDVLAVMYDTQGAGGTVTYLRTVIDRWTFQDKAMGEQYVTFDCLSESPVAWTIGDYCLFRGQTYSLNYIPSVTQKAGSGKAMDAFRYEGVKMDSFADELTRCEMLDVVLTSGQHDPDAGTNHTGSSKFDLFCGEVTVMIDDEPVTRTAVMTLGDRILANLNRMYTGGRTWSIEYGPGTHTEDQMLSFDGQKVSEALAEVKNKFDLDYSIQGRTIKIGCELGNVADVDYGKGYPTVQSGGKGLFEIKRVADSNQQIVTRLRVLGSTKNLPYRYYNKAYELSQSLFPTALQLPDTFLPMTGTATHKRVGDPDNKTQGNTWRGSSVRAVKGDSNDAYIDKGDDAASTVEGIREASIRFDGSDSKLKEIYPTIENVTYDELRGSNVPDQSGATGENAFPGYGGSEHVDRLMAVGYEYDGTMYDDANVGNGILSEDGETDRGTVRTVAIAQHTETLTLVDGVYRGEERTLFEVTGVTAGKYFFTPVAGKEPYFVYSGLGSFAAGYIIRVKQTVSGATTTIAEYESDFYSGLSSLLLPSVPDAYFMDDAKVREIEVTGTATVTVTFTPCVKGTSVMQYSVGSRNMTGYTAEYVWSDINNMDSANMPFHVFVKDMGFDFTAQFNGGTPVIQMKSGLCVGRSFQIGESVEPVVYDGKAGWLLTLTRDSDSSLNTYYPSARNTIAADDQFVITGIDMPDAYIKAAEMRLLVAATLWLAENGDTHFSYQPSIDDIYLKRDYDNMVAAGTVEDSVFWRLYAGYSLSFVPIAYGPGDTPGAVSATIESVSITMGESLTRKVDIVLNDDLKESTLKRVAREVDSLSREIQSAGSGMSSAIMEATVRKVGDRQYLSKVDDDTAEGDITFNGTVRFNRQALFPEGAFFAERADGSFATEIDGLGNIHAGGGVSAEGITDLSVNGGGGTGSTNSVEVNGQEYPADVDGVIHLPDYPDALSDLSEDTSHMTVSQSEKDTWNAKYSKPSGGIPKTDLSQEVRASLDKADGAVQKTDLAGKGSNVRPVYFDDNAEAQVIDGLHVPENVEAGGGVSARGITDLGVSGGGGGTGGGVETVSVNGGTPAQPDSFGNVDLDIVLADLPQDSTHRTVSDTEKSQWNAAASKTVVTYDNLDPTETESTGKVPTAFAAALLKKQIGIEDNSAAATGTEAMIDGFEDYDSGKSYTRGDTFRRVDATGHLVAYRVLEDMPTLNFGKLQRINFKALITPLTVGETYINGLT